MTSRTNISAGMPRVQRQRTQHACKGLTRPGCNTGPAGAPSRCSRPRSRRPPRTRWHGGSGTCSPSRTPAPQHAAHGRPNFPPHLHAPDLPQHHHPLYRLAKPQKIRAIQCAGIMFPLKMHQPRVLQNTWHQVQRAAAGASRALRRGPPAQGPLPAQLRRRRARGGLWARAWAGPPARGTMWIFMGWLATSSTHCAGPAKPSRYFHIVKLVGCCARACTPRPVRPAPSAQSSPRRARRSGSRTRGRAQPLSAYSPTATRPRGLRRRAVRRRVLVASPARRRPVFASSVAACATLLTEADGARGTRALTQQAGGDTSRGQTSRWLARTRGAASDAPGRRHSGWASCQSRAG